MNSKEEISQGKFCNSAVSTHLVGLYSAYKRDYNFKYPATPSLPPSVYFHDLSPPPPPHPYHSSHTHPLTVLYHPVLPASTLPPHPKHSRVQTFKLLRSPGIDSKESIRQPSRFPTLMDCLKVPALKLLILPYETKENHFLAVYASLPLS